MKLRSFYFTALMALAVIRISSVVQAQENPYLAIQLEDGNTVYGNILESNETTVTVQTIWARNMVLFRDDIAEMIQTRKSRQELYADVTTTIVDKVGSKFTGNVLAADADSLVMKTSSGIRLVIPQDKIQRISTSKKGVAAEKPTPVITQSSGGVTVVEFPRQDYGYWNGDRMFALPTGFTVDEGEVYGGLYYIIAPGMSFGIHKYFSLSAGISLIPFDREQIYFLNPKIGIYQSENFGAALSYIMIGSLGPGYDDLQLFEVVGSAKAGKFTGTLGIGWGLDQENSSDNAAISVGVDLELSRSVHFITESLISTGSNTDTYLMFGFRFVGRTVTGDISLWADPDSFNNRRNDTYLYPYFALYFHF